MAEGFARARKRKDVEVISAGIEASGIHPLAVRVMAEVGIDIAKYQSKALNGLDKLDFDLVIALCDQAAANCPVLPGFPAQVHWNLQDPDAVKGDEATVLTAFRGSRDQIRRLVDDLFDRGYLKAISELKRCEGTLLDNLFEGIIAHDRQRRIFFFNRAAEEITGYSRSEVIGRDCHEAFPGRFCGGKCLFCEATTPDIDVEKREIEIATKSGEQRLLETSLRAMKDASGTSVGFLVSFRDLTRERALARRVHAIENFSGIIGRDVRMLELFDLIRELANSDAPVLIQGESGTGKELVAAAIHNEGPRANKQFVPVNCGALPESLLESELFGHVKGAFTCAIRDKKGRFELADGGTFFLDEIADITPTMQVKLLRVLQEGRFERVGSEITLKVNVRVVSATNKDIAKELASGRFRDDLYYRLSVVPLWIPPLRERRNDIPLLADHVLRTALSAAGRAGVTLSAEALCVMMSYDWPGNVRELQNWLQFALVKCKQKVILPEHLPPPRGGAAPPAARPHRRRKLDVATVRAALNATKGNKVEAARQLGVSRATLYRFLDDANL